MQEDIEQEPQVPDVYHLPLPGASATPRKSISCPSSFHKANVNVSAKHCLHSTSSPPCIIKLFLRVGSSIVIQHTISYAKTPAANCSIPTKGAIFNASVILVAFSETLQCPRMSPQVGPRSFEHQGIISAENCCKASHRIEGDGKRGRDRRRLGSQRIARSIILDSESQIGHPAERI